MLVRLNLNKLSDNIVFFMPLSSLFYKARLRDIKENSFGIKEFILIDTPDKPFTQSGFQLGCMYIKRDYSGDIKFIDWRGK